MTMYASKTPRDLNRDPEPYVSVQRLPFGKIEFVRQPEARGVYFFEPRPEFDGAQHNEPNPILPAFRHEYTRTPSGDRERLIFAWLSWFREPFHEWTADQIDHARRVLTRLARLSEGA